ncbi:MAG: GNAT family N-acetyltransferase [Clostridia bacterium]|nr:GNAT family N-acetyltransferase [Clostridia bacterium]
MKNIKLKKAAYKFKSKRQIWKRIAWFCFVILLCILIFALCMFFPPFKIQSEEALVGVVSVIITVLSAVFVVFQLSDTEHITCCDMLANMNISFIENERLMLLYQKLEECYRDSSKKLEIQDDSDEKTVHTADLVAYFTFFEVLNEYVKHNIVTIAQLDDLFGYRFFILVHNKYIQERELYAVPSSYVNIFQLYDVWMEYRRINATKKGGRLVIMQENQIPDYYLKNKTYLQERLFCDYEYKEVQLQRKGDVAKKSFRQISLFPRDLKAILKLQDKIVEGLSNQSIFEQSTEEEILESMLVDACCGLYDGERLIALSIIVFNRQTKRNLSADWDDLKKKTHYWEYVTFDTIQVDPEYRGYGIQKYFLDYAEKLAVKVEAEYVIATVAPENTHSLNNFIEAEYEKHPTKCPYKKYGSDRNLVRKKINNG